jgi:hypothetical protein
MLEEGKRLTGSSGGPDSVGQPTEGANAIPAHWPNGHRLPDVYEIRAPEMTRASKGCRNNDPQEISHLIVKPCAVGFDLTSCYEIRKQQILGIFACEARAPLGQKAPVFA